MHCTVVMHLARTRIGRAASLLTVVSLLASTVVGCGGNAADPTPDDQASAVKVGDLKPVNAALVVNRRPARHESITGAHAWQLYVVKGSDIGKDHKTFDGYIAYGTDADDQVVWAIAIDGNGNRTVMKVEPNGTTQRTTFSDNMQAALTDEVASLWVELGRDDAADSQVPTKTTTWILGGMMGTLAAFFAFITYVAAVYG